MGAVIPAALSVTCFWPAPTIAQEVGAPPAGGAEQVVITGAKRESVSDAELRHRVETTLASNPYLDASRVTVTSKDGVVTLQGLIGDDWDLMRAIRLADRIPGARRVINELDTFDFDGGN